MDDDLHHSRPDPQDALTWRENEILALMAQGLSSREIAERLFLSLNTIKWYNRQIFNKLGVNSRREAVEGAASLMITGNPSPATPLHNLSAQTTPFIGRAGEMENLSSLLSSGSIRLVTILAPGGMGKTRLALAAAETLRAQFADGVYFVSLAPLTLPEQLLPAIAHALRFQLSPDPNPIRRQVLDFLSSKHLLLVLDNFDHLVEGATLLSDLLEAAPNLHLLVTSRERLNLTCETLYPLWGMGYPEMSQTASARAYSAIQLFLECGRRASPQTSFDNIASIIHICKLVQGMPLAIELAGAWVTMLSPAEIALEIGRSLDFLQTNMRDLPERQRSIRAVFEASWARLSEEEQSIFRRLSVFRGGFTRQAFQAITSASAGSLLALIDKSLISYSPDRGRCEVHELLRQFAAEKLEQAEETYAARRQHALYFTAFLSERLLALHSQIQPNALREIQSDFANLREAVDFLLDVEETENNVRMLEDLRQFFEAWVRLTSAAHHPSLPSITLRLIFETRSRFNADATALFLKAADKVQATEAQVSIHEGLGDSLQVVGSYTQARLEFEQAKHLLRPSAFVPCARLLRKLARTLDADYRFEDALDVLAEAREALEDANERNALWQQEWLAVQNDILSAYFFLGKLPPALQQKDDLRIIIERIKDQFGPVNPPSP